MGLGFVDQSSGWRWGLGFTGAQGLGFREFAREPHTRLPSRYEFGVQAKPPSTKMPEAQYSSPGVVGLLRQGHTQGGTYQVCSPI